MITKEQSAYSVRHNVVTIPDGVYSYAMLNYGSNTIKYREGPKFTQGKLNWKECDHTYGRQYFTGPGFRVKGRYEQLAAVSPVIANPVFVSYAGTSMPSVESVYNQLWDQLDLNCHDSVLLYSGILQAVPLVGGALKFVSVMNQLGRKLSKGLKRQPFTTVLRAAISADFINRFVIRPTIDDARKFLDAHNYVIRVMNTAYERSGQLPTAYEMHASSKNVKSSSYRSRLYMQANTWSDLILEGEAKSSTGYDTTVKVLANVSYNTSAIDPIKLWASRMGITKPFESAWDLVPFSFVVDYFTRAGEFISGISDQLADQDALRGRIQTIHGAWAMIKQEQRYDVRVTSVTPVRSSDQVMGFAPFNMGARQGRFQRYPVNPFAQPMESSDGFLKFDLSSTRLRTLLELIVQAKTR